MELGLRQKVRDDRDPARQEEHHRTFFRLPERTHPSLLFCLPGRLSLLHEGLEASCPAAFSSALYSPGLGATFTDKWPSLMHALASLPERGDRVLLHTVSRTGVPPRGVVAGSRTMLFYLSGAHTHHR